MDKTESGGQPVQPQYRTTFFFVSTMLAGIVVGWILLLGLLLRRY